MSNKASELKICYDILEKLEEELKDCKNDYKFLKEQEDDSKEYNAAREAVIERAEGLKITIKTIKERIASLEEN